jgi:hypothetical protein
MFSPVNKIDEEFTNTRNWKPVSDILELLSILFYYTAFP